ncbi:hypothetical protein KHA96_22120 [Bacillus sp. FJAT-49711]|uniref:hypothetical protein n=1 Tax=Bacillus sp. FJAT-49711 TaxID=2833585 RepID=UPI001BC9D685|nr:hypothetical protein [Bacillus sp. FJAT-49711]MBS4220994.1 hypothetical protein [Bacillus sp. FJAT-49711]
MVFNIYGIAISAFKSRLNGKRIEKTGLLYETKMIMSIIIIFPTALIHGFALNLLGVPVIDFD